jgi:murein DD-endopeptidase MepM/ murein hydrolase activator NlpD
VKPESRRRRLHVVVARGDGTRTLSLTVPRWTIRGVVAMVAAGLAGLGFLVADYTAVRATARANVDLVERFTAKQQEALRLRGELDAVRTELNTWPSLHAKVVSPFGKAGATFEALPATNSIGDVTGTVRRATGTLRQIAGVMMRLDTVIAQLPTQWPVRSAIASEFGHRRDPFTNEREFHEGVDLTASHGTPVKAPAAGAVAHAGNHGGYGLAVIVDHGSGVQTLYGHLSRVSVKHGERVARGQLLGHAGNTGRSTGAHLHYEVMVRGRPVNPRSYLWD